MEINAIPGLSRRSGVPQVSNVVWCSRSSFPSTETWKAVAKVSAETDSDALDCSTTSRGMGSVTKLASVLSLPGPVQPASTLT